VRTRGRDERIVDRDRELNVDLVEGILDGLGDMQIESDAGWDELVVCDTVGDDDYGFGARVWWEVDVGDSRAVEGEGARGGRG
jgi:hypothetical protein